MKNHRQAGSHKKFPHNQAKSALIQIYCSKRYSNRGCGNPWHLTPDALFTGLRLPLWTIFSQDLVRSLTCWMSRAKQTPTLLEDLDSCNLFLFVCVHEFNYLFRFLIWVSLFVFCHYLIRVWLLFKLFQSTNILQYSVLSLMQTIQVMVYHYYRKLEYTWNNRENNIVHVLKTWNLSRETR